MAGLADLMVQSGLQTSQNAPDISGAVTKGAQLAQTMEQIEAQRSQIESQKQQLQLDKVNKVMDAVEKGMQFKDKSAQNMFFKNYIPSMVKALKVDDFFNPDVMGFMQGSEEVRMKLVGLRLDIQNRINNGDLKGAEILEYAKSKLNPEELPMLDTDSLLEQQKFAASEEGKYLRGKVQAEAAMGKQIQAQQAAPEVERKKKLGALYNDWEVSGGSAGTQTRVKAMQDVYNMLKNREVEFGTIGKNIPYGASLDVLARTDPKAKAAIDKIRRSINVKQRTGDPNPTSNQIDQIYAQAIDPRLSNEDNMEKLKTEIEAELQADKNARMQFKEAGLLKEGKGSKDPAGLFTPEKKKQFKALPPDKKEKALSGLAKKLNLPMSEVRKMLGAE